MLGEDLFIDEKSNESKVAVSINKETGFVSEEVQKVFDEVIAILSNKNQQQFPLLRIACLGNAEKTIQGELFFHLRKKGFNAVIEGGYRCKDASTNKVSDRHIDITVFNGQWEPIVTIELKHYSPNQSSSIDPLLSGLEADYNKRPIGIPLIQIGLYTEISKVAPCPIQQSNFPLLQHYRFLTAKSYKILSSCTKWNIGTMNKIFQIDKSTAGNWQFRLQYSQITNLVRGYPEAFDVKPLFGTTLRIEGCVNWIAMLAP